MVTAVPLLQDSTLSWDKRNLDSIEQLARGATLQWLENGRIVCFTVTDISRPVVDAWLTWSYEIVKIWPADVPYLAIQDVSGATLTPYIRERSKQTTALTPQYLGGRSAVVIPRSVMNQAMRLFVTVTLARQHTKIQRNVFLSRDAAIRWVLDYRG